MEWLFWNCKGIGRPGFKSQFKHLSNTNKLNLFYLVEPRQSLSKYGLNFFNQFFYMNLAFPMVGQAGGVCLFWNSSAIHLDILFAYPRFVHCHVTNKRTNLTWFATLFFYASP